jgi:hypothetical protein
MDTNTFLKWTNARLGRRRFLAKALAGAFGVIAGLTVGQARLSADHCCIGPFGTGWCGSANCNGQACKNSAITTCAYAWGYCIAGSPCWTGSVNCPVPSCYQITCCDCGCYNVYVGSFYCYCQEGR